MIAFLPGADKAREMDRLVKSKELQALADFLFLNQRFILKVAEVITSFSDNYGFNDWQIKYTQMIATRKSIKRGGHESGGNDVLFIQLVGAVYDLAYNMPDKSKKESLGRLRGAVLEALVSRILHERYKELGTNCNVSINGTVVTIPGFRYPKSIDVAGVDSLAKPREGEMYECKVGVSYIEEEDLDFLSTLREQLNRANLKNILVALVSFERRVLLRQKIAYLKVGFQDIIAREDLSNLKDYNSVRAFLTGTSSS